MSITNGTYPITRCTGRKLITHQDMVMLCDAASAFDIKIRISVTTPKGGKIFEVQVKNCTQDDATLNHFEIEGMVLDSSKNLGIRGSEYCEYKAILKFDPETEAFEIGEMEIFVRQRA